MTFVTASRTIRNPRTSHQRVVVSSQWQQGHTHHRLSQWPLRQRLTISLDYSMVASLCCTSPPTPGDKIILGMCRIVCQIGHPSHTHFHSRSRRSHAHQIFFQHLLLQTCYKHYNHVTTHHAATTRRMLGGVHSTYSKRFPLEQLQERQQGMMLSIVLLPPL